MQRIMQMWWTCQRWWRRWWLFSVIIFMATMLLLAIAYLLTNYSRGTDKVFQSIAYGGTFIGGMVALSTYLKSSSPRSY